MEIVYITFEKLTGLKGEIEGFFSCHPAEIDPRLPLVHITGDVFRQDNHYIRIQPTENIENFHEHFQYGTNFLIKEWSYGRGVKVDRSRIN